MSRQYQVVIQFAAETIEDFDKFVSFEEALSSNLNVYAEVDGHDFGCGEFNIFLLTQYPTQSFEISERLRRLLLPDSIPVIAYRDLLSEEYIVLWPPGQEHFNLA